MREISEKELKDLLKKALAFDIIKIHGKDYVFSGSILQRLDKQAEVKMQKYKVINKEDF